MASAIRSLSRSARFLAWRGPIACSTRSFSASAYNFMPNDPVPPPPPKEPKPEDFPSLPEWSPDQFGGEERSMYNMMSPEDRVAFDADKAQRVADFNDPEKRAAAFAEIEKRYAQVEKEEDMRFEDPNLRQPGFWGEDDDELGQVEEGDDEMADDEITSTAHAELELHREMREYARITAWDMPMLSKLAKPFSLPPETHILRFRYTTYMGEQHPVEPKVVMELASHDLTPKYLTEAQRQTFLKLVGPRYNPQTDIVRMSSEKFSSRAQNKRYLADVVNTLIKEAKEGDTFDDIPLDLRHHKPKPTNPQFPEEWKMTDERRKQLEARRAERLTAQQERQGIVDGNAVVEHAIQSLPSLTKPTEERERLGIKAGARLQKKQPR